MKKPFWIKSLLPVLALASLTLGCEDEPKPPAGPQPPEVVLPEEPEQNDEPGHWAVAQRGIALDSEDFAVITEQDGFGISVAELGSAFGMLVVNRPYVDWRASPCVDPSDAVPYQPSATVERFVDALNDQRGVSFDTLAVNVDLLTPDRKGLLFVCYGVDRPRFDVPAHRQAVINAFVELARVPNLKHITVGLEMNRYYHLSTPEGTRLIDDYTNFITLYREVYAAIKAENPAIQVGPGLNWAVFIRRTVPEIADELGLPADSLEAFVRAWERTIKPLLQMNGNAVADYVGVTVIPFQSEVPFEGQPNPEDADHIQEIREYYRRLPLFANGLPVALPQIDWATPSASSANLKGAFLVTLKEALSHTDIAWAAWRRSSDLPATADASPCAKFTQAREASLAYPEDFCYSGLVSEAGARGRGLLEALLIDP